MLKQKVVEIEFRIYKILLKKRNEKWVLLIKIELLWTLC